jgi:hypothetical protein
MTSEISGGFSRLVVSPTRCSVLDDAPQSRDRLTHGLSNGPGSAKRHGKRHGICRIAPGTPAPQRAFECQTAMKDKRIADTASQSRDASAPGVWFTSSPSFEKRARGTPDARLRPQPRVRNEFGHTSFSHHESTGSSGVPHAMVFAACFACPPVGDPLLPTVVVDRAALPPRRKALRAVPMLWREASRREHATWADARSDASGANLRPGRIAQRGRQPKLRPPQALLRPRTHPLRGVRSRRARAPAPLLRPDAAASTAPAPRIVTIAKRPSMWGGMHAS